MMKGSLVIIYMTQINKAVGSEAKVVGIIIQHAEEGAEASAKLREGV